MRTLLARPLPSAGRLARTLALALTLCACGGGGSGDAADPPDSAAQDAGTAASRGRPAPPTCLGPPPGVPSDRLKGTWANLLEWVRLNGVQFSDSTVDSTTTRVQLSREARPDSMTISSEFRMPCLTSDSLKAMRISAIYTLNDSVTVPEWGHTFKNGDSIFAFTGGTDTTAILAYRSGENVALAPDFAWRFRYCPEPVPGRRRPQGKWRDTLDKPHGNGTDNGKGPDNQPGPGTYGWLACASGCCQFYIPPPIGDPGDRPGRGLGRPYCPEHPRP